MKDFTTVDINVGEMTIFARIGGAGPAVLLLHGFPETHLMWRDVAPRLAKRFTVVCADLPGYGRSGCRAPKPDHAPHSKRTMARDLVAAMEHLGYSRFSVAGHDRGGRVAYRMALDSPRQIERVGVLDVLPIGAIWPRADARLMLGFWPFTLLAQAAPLPERILISVGDEIVNHALQEWGSTPSVFPDDVRCAYTDSLRDPAHAQSISEEYRAAATIDADHDLADQAAGVKISCPLLVLWSARGPLGSWYDADGGPLGIWRAWAHDVRGQAFDGGHFFPEELPEQTAMALGTFFS